MSGRRPDATQAFSFVDHFRECGVGDKWSSFPQYFRDRGYTVLGVGKLLHPGLPPSFLADGRALLPVRKLDGACNARSPDRT